ncbi:MAG TPA: hypothetical protein VKT52_07755, partial [Ktedonobacterales bacterium]|nr:hypothetical protein [Ktedonobacterales bacterium]
MTTPPNRPVGITKGPGETIHEYTFISRDEQRLLKNGEYVYYELENLDSGRIGNIAPSLGEAENRDSGKNGNRHSPLPRGEGLGVGSRRVLGRILRRVPVQLYPDTFLSEPEVPPSQVAALVGYDARASDLFELHVGILGYYDTILGTFVNPWIPPSSGTAIYLADDALLADVLSRKHQADVGS